MSRTDNYAYFKARVQVEREAASHASTVQIASIHEQLADAYEAFVAEIEARPPLHLVSSTPELVQHHPPAADLEASEATGTG